VLFAGLPAMRYLWVPWLYLFFAIPLPQRLYFAFTDPLRRWAAEMSVTVMSVVPALQIQRNGSVIEAVYDGEPFKLGVADACAGMRSTITLCAIGVAVAFLSERPWWHRVILVASCLPIAIFCNMIRVLITTWLYIFVDEKYAEGTPHQMLGIVTLGLAFALFSLLGWVLNRLFLEEEVDDREDLSESRTEAPTV
jgi:exosortase